MVDNRCSVSHKYGPFILVKDKNAANKDKNAANKDKTIAKRECLCCGHVTEYYPVGKDILEAIKNQDDVNLFKDPIVYKEFNDGGIEFTMLVDFIRDLINYLFVNIETQDALVRNMEYYNNILNNKDSFNHKLVSDMIQYLKLYFAKDRYEIKFGSNSFPDEDNDKMDEIYDEVYKRFITFREKYKEEYDKKNHLLR